MLTNELKEWIEKLMKKARQTWKYVYTINKLLLTQDESKFTTLFKDNLMIKLKDPIPDYPSYNCFDLVVFRIFNKDKKQLIYHNISYNNILFESILVYLLTRDRYINEIGFKEWGSYLVAINPLLSDYLTDEMSTNIKSRLYNYCFILDDYANNVLPLFK